MEKRLKTRFNLFFIMLIYALGLYSCTTLETEPTTIPTSKNFIKTTDTPELISTNTKVLTPVESTTEALVPTETGTTEATYTLTPTPTENWAANWGERYWTPEQIIELISDRDYCFEQFLWDPELPDGEDPYMPDYPFTMEIFISPPEDFTTEDYDRRITDYAKELSAVPADYICDRLYTWFVQGYGWPTEPNSDERFDHEMMLDQGVYYSVISDPDQEPYCSQFNREKREDTLLLLNNPDLLEEWIQQKETP